MMMLLLTTGVRRRGVSRPAEAPGPAGEATDEQ